MRKAYLLAGCVSVLATGPTFAFAQQAAAASQSQTIEELIVTAQKREQSINDVGMSISAVTGVELAKRGVQDARDLTKIAPGFSFAETPIGTPVYTLRGVGFNEQSLAATPTVSFYVDEVPLPYPVMTQGSTLDLERVEILKGPQGTLFGQNSTGGAINYIAAKPTSKPEYGYDVSYGRFNEIDADGYISGPLSDTVKARLAIGTVQRFDGWQKNYTRDDTLGEAHKANGRLTVDWTPTDKVSLRFNVNGWWNGSDTQAGQLIAVTPQIPAQLPANMLNYPLPPHNDQAADWNAGVPLRHNDEFYQLSVRADYQISSDLTLTSITAYDYFRERARYDTDGVHFENADQKTAGQIRTFTEEVRLAGQTPRLDWILGANYQKDDIVEQEFIFLDNTSTDHSLGFFLNGSNAYGATNNRSAAVFGNAEYKLTDSATVQGGIRYTNGDKRSDACLRNYGNGGLGLIVAALSSRLRNGAPTPVIAPNGCATLDQNLLPNDIIGSLKEDPVSWRVGVTWKVAPSSLLYASVSQGYKDGSFRTGGGTNFTNFAPVTEESLLAYEAGFKTGLFERRVQLNGAVFYYDYRDKQLLGKLTQPIFGVSTAMVNIPKSRVEGAELELTARPIEGLTVSASATYLHTEILQFVGFDSIGNFGDQAGTPFNFAPKWNAVADAEYERPLNEHWKGFVGGTLTYHSATNGGIGAPPILAIDAYTLLDLRAGVRAADGAWSLSAWGRNVTNEYYWNDAFRQVDTTLRYTGMPATYGITLSHRFQ